MEVISWAAVICSITGNMLVNLKSFWAFPAWILGNIMWVIFDLHSHGWRINKNNRARVLMYLVYTGMNIYGLINWL